MTNRIQGDPGKLGLKQEWMEVAHGHKEIPLQHHWAAFLGNPDSSHWTVCLDMSSVIRSALSGWEVYQETSKQHSARVVFPSHGVFFAKTHIR